MKETSPHNQPFQNSTKKRFFPTPSPTEWLCLIGGVLLAFWYSWIIDDAYIYFRYVDNFLFLKIGLVYNAGEFVEGFSSPAWTLLLIALRSMRIPYWVIIRVVAIFSSLLFWTLLVITNRKASEDTPQSSIINFPLLSLTFTYGAISYFSSGLETPLVMVIAAAYACFFLFPQSRLLQIAVALSPLIRPELILPLGIIVAWRTLRERKPPWILCLTALAANGGWLVFRIWYYADFFPNTFYLKNIVSVFQGLCYLYDTFLPYATIPILMVFLCLYLFLKQTDTDWDTKSEPRVLMVIVALSLIGYVIKIGGDARHFRYLIFPYCLLLIATAGIAERTIVKLKLHSFPRLILLLGYAIALFSFLSFPRQLKYHPIIRHLQRTGHARVLGINDGAVHRANLLRTVTPPLFSVGNADEQLPAKKQFQKAGQSMLREKILIFWECNRAYRNFTHYVIQDLGLTEPLLARVDIPANRPGHKFGLQRLARDIYKIRSHYGFGENVFQKAVDEGRAPSWIRKNIKTITLIERKVYNTHDLPENMAIACSRQAISLE